MTGCRDAEAPYCQCAACAGDCCCRAEHLHLPCPVADCPDYVPRGRDDFVPVLTSKQLAERQAAQAAITPARPANHACRNTRQAGRGKGRVGQNPSTRLMRPGGTGPKRRKA